ncbi:hypothetical protein GC169_11480 [bacterium]|nr:hypothetical protein [bacterium]
MNPRILALSTVAIAASYLAFLVLNETAIPPAPRAAAPEPDGPTRTVAFVANALDGSVTLIGAEDAEVLATINTIPDGRRVRPWRDPMQGLIGQMSVEAAGGRNYAEDVEVSPDGSVLYVSRGHLADVAAFDIASGALLWRAPVRGFKAGQMALAPDGSRLFVSAVFRGVVEAIDTSTGRKAGFFVTGELPGDLKISADGRRVYAAVTGDPGRRGAAPTSLTALAIADAATLQLIETHEFGAGLQQFALSPEGRILFAKVEGSADLLAYDLATRRVIGRRAPGAPIQRPSGPISGSASASGPSGIAITDNGALLCLADRASATAVFLATTGLDHITRVQVGDAPAAAVITPDQTTCMLANALSDDVSFITIGGFVEWARVKVGRGPAHITIAEVPDAVIEPLVEDERQALVSEVPSSGAAIAGGP